jgi:uncharacterized protein (DUF1778 family)
LSRCGYIVASMPDAHRSKIIKVRVSDEELAVVDASARASGLDLSTWVRYVAVTNAKAGETVVAKAHDAARAVAAAVADAYALGQVRGRSSLADYERNKTSAKPARRKVS